MADARPFVLVVDDQPGIRELLRRSLEPAGYRVGAVEDVATARRVLVQERVAAIVLDVHLAQHHSGLELLEWVRLSGRTPTLPVLVLTGYQMTTEEEIVIRRCGAYVFYKTQGIAQVTEYLHRLVRRGGSPPI